MGGSSEKEASVVIDTSAPSVAEGAHVGAHVPKADLRGGDGDELDAWIDEIHFEEIDSTQAFAEREHEKFVQHHLTVVSADFQTSGRGTKDRSWEAPRGKSVLATFYFKFPPDLPTAFINRNAPNVTKVVSLSAIDALNFAVRSAGLEEQPCFQVKWPNDILANQQKVGGVLAKAMLSTSGRLDSVLVGIGLNINQVSDDMCKISRPVWPAASLRMVTKQEKEFEIAPIRRKLIKRFADQLQIFYSEGFAAFREKINSLEVFLGSEVRFRVSENEVVKGLFHGVDDEGLIVLQLNDGTKKSFPSGEILPSDST